MGATSYNVDAFSNRLNQAGLTAFNRQYDAAGNLLEDTNYTYSYSARGRLQSVTRKSDGATTAYAYNGLGQRTKKTGVAATAVTQYVYDEQGHLLGEYDYYGRPLQETVYLGDLPVAVLSQTVGGGSTTGAVTADNSVGSASPAANWPVATDAASQGGGHQTHAAVTAASSDSFTWTLNLASPGKYFIQARWTIPANTTMANDATYTISGANTGGTTVRAMDQRGNSNTWAYLGLMNVSAAGPVTVKLAPSSTGKVSADAVRALPVTNATTSANNIFTDHLYAPRVITRASDNQMVWRWDNADPFGVGQPDTNPAGIATTFTYNPGFPGQVYDNETGLHYNYHRTYSPAIGGYTQPDPIGLQGGQLSLYSYVGGNPVNYTDPTGQFAVLPWIGPIIYRTLPIIVGCIATNCTKPIGDFLFPPYRTEPIDIVPPVTDVGDQGEAANDENYHNPKPNDYCEELLFQIHIIQTLIAQNGGVADLELYRTLKELTKEYEENCQDECDK